MIIQQFIKQQYAVQYVLVIRYVSINNNEQHTYQETVKRKHKVVFPLRYCFLLIVHLRTTERYTTQELNNLLHTCSNRYLTKCTRAVLEQQLSLFPVSNSVHKFDARC